jgi:threonine dehydratase
VLEDLPEAEAILVPVGGGGLIAGVAVAAKAINPQVRVIGVQPEASPAAYLSLRDGRPYEKYNAAPTIADGLAGGFGRLPFEIAGDLIDKIVLVSEEETRAAVFTLLKLAQLVVEGAGAVGIAALMAGKVNLAGRKVVAVLTGANIDASLLFEIMIEQLNHNNMEVKRQK